MPSNSSQQETEVTYANIIDIRSKLPLPSAPDDEICDLIIKIENGEIDPILIVSPRLWIDTKNKDNFKLWCALSFIRTSMLRVIKVPVDNESIVEDRPLTAQERRVQELIRRMDERAGPRRPTFTGFTTEVEEDVELPEFEEEEEEEPRF